MLAGGLTPLSGGLRWLVRAGRWKRVSEWVRAKCDLDEPRTHRHQGLPRDWARVSAVKGSGLRYGSLNIRS